MTEQQINEQTMKRLEVYRDLKRDGYHHQADVRVNVCTCCGKNGLRTEHWMKHSNGRRVIYFLRACRDCGYLAPSVG